MILNKVVLSLYLRSDVIREFTKVGDKYFSFSFGQYYPTTKGYLIHTLNRGSSCFLLDKDYINE